MGRKMKTPNRSIAVEKLQQMVEQPKTGQVAGFKKNSGAQVSEAA